MQQTSSSDQTGTITRQGERVIVVGHVRSSNRQQLKDLAGEALAEYGHATIDLKDALYIDASGVAALVAVAQYAAFARKQLVVANANAEFKEFIATTEKFASLFTFVDDAK